MTAELLLATLELEKGLDKDNFEGTDKENMRKQMLELSVKKLKHLGERRNNMKLVYWTKVEVIAYYFW